MVAVHFRQLKVPVRRHRGIDHDRHGLDSGSRHPSAYRYASRNGILSQRRNSPNRYEKASGLVII